MNTSGAVPEKTTDSKRKGYPPIEVEYRGELFEIHAHGTRTNGRVYRVVLGKKPTGKVDSKGQPIYQGTRRLVRVRDRELAQTVARALG